MSTQLQARIPIKHMEETWLEAHLHEHVCVPCPLTPTIYRKGPYLDSSHLPVPCRHEVARGSLPGARRLAQTVPHLSSSDSSLMSLDWAAEGGSEQASNASPCAQGYASWDCTAGPHQMAHRPDNVWQCLSAPSSSLAFSASVCMFICNV